MILLSLLSAFLNSSIGALAYVRGRGQPLYRAFAIMGLSFGLWNIAFAGAWPDFNDPFWVRLMFSPLTWLPAAILSFVWCYTGLPEGTRRKRTVPLYAVGALLLGMLWSQGISLDAVRLAVLMSLFPSISLCLGLLWRHWLRASDPAERNRRGYMLTAALIGSLGTITDIAPYIGLPPLPRLAAVSLMAYSIIVIAAVTKHHLLDLSAAVSRAALMIGSAFALSLLMSALAWVTSRFEGPLFLNFFLLSLILLAFLLPAWERVNQALSRVFFKRQFEREQAIDRLESRLEAALDARGIAEAASEMIRQAWSAEARLLFVPRSLRGLETAASLPEGLPVLLAGRLEPATIASLQREAAVALAECLRRNQAEAVVPIRREGELVGALLLGAPAEGFYDAASLRALSRAAHDLSRALKAAEMTAELLRAERLSQIGQLSAGIAHEVRNPLSAILGAVEVMKLGITEEKRNDILEILKSEVMRLDGVLTEIIDYAANKPKDARCEWSQAWGRMEKLVRAELPRNVKLVTTGPKAELAVSGAHLQQMLLNLVKNAARAAKDSPAPRVEVHADVDGKTAVVSVTDNGGGIPADVLPKLFTAFTTASAGGTGLGLATVRRLAEGYGGRAWAENLKGGARFSLELPTIPAGR